MSEATTTKKARSPQISQNAFLHAMINLRNSLGIAPTLHQITTYFNTHTWDGDASEWKDNPEGVVGKRESLAVSSRLSQLRGDIEDNEKISKDDCEVLLGILEITGERKATDFNSIVSSIKSLGLLRVPANMVQKGSDHVGTNGQPVDSIVIETGEKSF